MRFVTSRTTHKKTKQRGIVKNTLEKLKLNTENVQTTQKRAGKGNKGAKAEIIKKSPQIYKMVDLNSNISIIELNANSLTSQIKRQRVSE